MLNWTSKLTLVATILAGTVSFAPNASAGEGGVAGAASFDLEGGSVEQSSVSAAVGKDSAYAGAQTGFQGISGPATTQAIAAGTGGIMNFTGNSIFIQDIQEDSSLGTAQQNQIDSQEVNVDVINGTVDINAN